MKHLLPVTIMICISLQGLAQAPSFVWAKGLFSAAGSYGGGNCVKTDPAGNVYSIGEFSGTFDFDPGIANFNLSSAGGSTDIFVSKLDASGNFVWAKAMGGSLNGDDYGSSIAVDALGNAYTTGFFEATVDFDPGPATYNLSVVGAGTDIFICKLNSAGSFTWAKRIGGNLPDAGTCIISDAVGNIYITGYFVGTVDFDPGVGTFNLTGIGSASYGFVCKLDAYGNFVWAKSLGDGGLGSCAGNSIALDKLGNIYSTGTIYGSGDFDPGSGVFILNSAGMTDIFVSKLDSSGNFVWAKSMGGSNFDEGLSIAIDSTGNSYTTGYFKLTSDFDPDSSGVFNLTSEGDRDIFISKLDVAGNFMWGKGIGGIDYDAGNSISIDIWGNVFTVGNYFGIVDFDPGAGAFLLNPLSGSYVSFISELDANGNFKWAGSFDGAAISASSIHTNNGGSIYTTGRFKYTNDFDPDTGVFNMSTLTQSPFLQKMNHSSTGLIENNLSNEFKIFPNPTSGNLIIQIKKLVEAITVKIINVTGQEVFSSSNKSTNTMNVTLDAPPGIYIVEIKTSEGSIKRMKILKVEI